MKLPLAADTADRLDRAEGVSLTRRAEARGGRGIELEQDARLANRHLHSLVVPQRVVIARAPHDRGELLLRRRAAGVSDRRQDPPKEAARSQIDQLVVGQPYR